MRLKLWPQSLFQRLIAALALAVLLAQGAALTLMAREREHFILQVNVREWSRRIAEMTAFLQPLEPAERTEAVSRLLAQPRRLDGASRLRSVEARSLARLDPAPGAGLIDPPLPLPRQARRRALTSPVVFVPVPLSADFESSLKQQLQVALGPAYQVAISPARQPAAAAIPVTGPVEPEGTGRLYDVDVRFPDGYTAVFRLTRQPWGAPLSRNLLLNLGLLIVVMAIALYLTARSITRPLSELAAAADNLGRDTRQPKLEEKGARELRNAARAFNTMQDRLRRYLDSRTRVLAAMSHDLKTPLTRLRLHVETLEDPAVQARFGKELDEMESMVRGALGLFRGLDDDEALTAIDVNALLVTLQSELAEMGGQVRIEGRAAHALTGKPQAIRRCLTNLLNNAIKFGSCASVRIEESSAVLVIRVRDEGPGIPPEELERVFEPFYRVESSRNRDTGGTGLGLSIARDITQAHGGSLVLRNLPERGLEALLVLPLDLHRGSRERLPAPGSLSAQA